MNLRHDVLRSRTPDTHEKRLVSFRPNVSHREEQQDSDDELVNVVCFSDKVLEPQRFNFHQVSIPGTPTRSRPHSRASSPRPGASTRPIPGSLYLPGNRRSASDPLRILPTELSQGIFGYLSVPQLALCALVSKKWNRSQTINYGTNFSRVSFRELTWRQCGSNTTVERISTTIACSLESGRKENQNRIGLVRVAITPAMR